MSQKILALCGRKQSGKNTSFNFLLGIEMLKLAVVREKIEVRTDGRLWISDIFGDDAYEGIFDVDRNNNTVREFCAEFVWPFIKSYSFADCLKRDVCINLLGLTHDQCYGTDQNKNEATHLKWEDMPKSVEGQKTEGAMTAREVMQFVGTEFFRKIYEPVWAEGTLNRITEHGSQMAVITDCRFPNEVEAVKKRGGKVIRLTRGQHSSDAHASELALDKENYDWNNFDAIIDNAEMSISDQNQALYQILHQWEWMDAIQVPENIEVK